VNKPVGYFMKGMVKRKMNIKDGICTTIGLCGSFIAGCFGGWDTGLVTLLIFMGIDYMSGLVVAGVFHNSNKTKTGALESRAGWKGLCRKCMTLLFVLIAYRLDLALGVNYIRDAVIIGFMANELISIVENAGLMGLPLPEVINKAIDILTQKGDEQNGQAGIH
jgi:toxin secretion/phage lysis holin